MYFVFFFQHFGGQHKKLCSHCVLKWLTNNFVGICVSLLSFLFAVFVYINFHLYNALCISFILLLGCIMKYLQCSSDYVNEHIPVLSWLCRHSQIRLHSIVSTAQNVMRLDKYWDGQFTLNFVLLQIHCCQITKAS